MVERKWPLKLFPDQSLQTEICSWVWARTRDSWIEVRLMVLSGSCVLFSLNSPKVSPLEHPLKTYFLVLPTHTKKKKKKENVRSHPYSTIKYQGMTDVNGETPLAIKFMWTKCNFTRRSFYIREQIYIYVKLHTGVNFVHVNDAYCSYVRSFVLPFFVSNSVVLCKRTLLFHCPLYSLG